MRNKRLHATVALLATGVLLFTGCGSKAEPVNAEPASVELTSEETGEETESTTDQTSGTGDTSGEIVEAEQPIEQGTGMTGEDTDMTGDEYQEQLEQGQEEANEADQNLNESTGIEIAEELDKTMYAQQNCNSRSGDGTNYDKIASIEKGAQLHVTGRTSNDWYRVEWGDGVVYIAGSLLGDQAPPASNQSPTSTPSTTNSSGSSDQLTPQDIQDIIDSLGGPSNTVIDPNGGNGWNWN